MREPRQKGEVTGLSLRWNHSLKAPGTVGVGTAIQESAIFMSRKKLCHLYRSVCILTQFQGIVYRSSQIFMKVRWLLVAVLRCGFFLRTRASSEVNHWKWMQYWTGTAGTNRSLQNRHKWGKQNQAETMTVSCISSQVKVITRHRYTEILWLR